MGNLVHLARILALLKTVRRSIRRASRTVLEGGPRSGSERTSPHGFTSKTNSSSQEGTASHPSRDSNSKLASESPSWGPEVTCSENGVAAGSQFPSEGEGPLEDTEKLLVQDAPNSPKSSRFFGNDCSPGIEDQPPFPDVHAQAIDLVAATSIGSTSSATGSFDCSLCLSVGLAEILRIGVTFRNSHRVQHMPDGKEVHCMEDSTAGFKVSVWRGQDSVPFVSGRMNRGLPPDSPLSLRLDGNVVDLPWFGNTSLRKNVFDSSGGGTYIIDFSRPWLPGVWETPSGEEINTARVPRDAEGWAYFGSFGSCPGRVPAPWMSHANLQRVVDQPESIPDPLPCAICFSEATLNAKEDLADILERFPKLKETHVIAEPFVHQMRDDVSGVKVVVRTCGVSGGIPSVMISTPSKRGLPSKPSAIRSSSQEKTRRDDDDRDSAPPNPTAAPLVIGKDGGSSVQEGSALVPSHSAGQSSTPPYTEGASDSAAGDSDCPTEFSTLPDPPHDLQDMPSGKSYSDDQVSTPNDGEVKERECDSE